MREECDRGGGELPEGEVPRAGDATDLRLAMDERTVLQQMFDEKWGELSPMKAAARVLPSNMPRASQTGTL